MPERCACPPVQSNWGGTGYRHMQRNADAPLSLRNDAHSRVLYASVRAIRALLLFPFGRSHSRLSQSLEGNSYSLQRARGPSPSYLYQATVIFTVRPASSRVDTRYSAEEQRSEGGQVELETASQLTSEAWLKLLLLPPCSGILSEMVMNNLLLGTYKIGSTWTSRKSECVQPNVIEARRAILARRYKITSMVLTFSDSS